MNLKFMSIKQKKTSLMGNKQMQEFKKCFPTLNTFQELICEAEQVWVIIGCKTADSRLHICWHKTLSVIWERARRVIPLHEYEKLKTGKRQERMCSYWTLVKCCEITCE